MLENGARNARIQRMTVCLVYALFTTLDPHKQMPSQNKVHRRTRWIPIWVASTVGNGLWVLRYTMARWTKVVVVSDLSIGIHTKKSDTLIDSKLFKSI